MFTNQCLILAGGYGTRISSVLGSTPKLLAPIGRTCFLDLFLRWIKESLYPIDHTFILATGFLHEKIADYVERNHLNITLSREVHQLGTLGAAYNASLIAESEHLLILNGDTLFSCCIAETLSEFFTDHTIGKLYKDLIFSLDKDKFQIFVFHSKKTYPGDVLNEFKNKEAEGVLKNKFMPTKLSEKN